jgi:hypothetical protein
VWEDAKSIKIPDKITDFPKKPQMLFPIMDLITNRYQGQNCNFAKVFVVCHAAFSNETAGK